jgi:tetratricopeptide (TPR) repeat protein
MAATDRWKKTVVIAAAAVAVTATIGMALHFKHERDRTARDLIVQKALLARQSGKLQQSFDLFQSLVKLSATDEVAVYEAANDANSMGDYNRAREGYLAALRLNRNNADARLKLVLLTAQAGVAEEAKHHFEELIAITSPADPRREAAYAALSKDKR